MKRLLIILTLILFFINTAAFAAENIVKKDIQVQAKDGFMLNATLEYPKVKNKKEYSTVVLLHSLGYSSQWWENLPDELMEKGYAVLLIDLRGHGKSVYNGKLVRTSWNRMTNKAYAKYPSDVTTIMDYVTSENKIKFFDNWAIVGSDVGASAGIIAAAQSNNKPKTVVMLSPSVNVRGLYIPVKLAELGQTDIFSISGTNDTISVQAQNYLSKFAQAAFITYTSESKSTGMMMLKHEEGLSKLIAEWIYTYLK